MADAIDDPRQQPLDMADLWVRMQAEQRTPAVEEPVTNETRTHPLTGAYGNINPPTGLWSGAFGMIQGNGFGPVK